MGGKFAAPVNCFYFLLFELFGRRSARFPLAVLWKQAEKPSKRKSNVRPNKMKTQIAEPSGCPDAIGIPGSRLSTTLLMIFIPRDDRRGFRSEVLIIHKEFCRSR